MKTDVYVDGFNLYYRALKGPPYKWLDLGQLCQRLLPSHQIHHIRYFTAILQPWRGNTREQRRQLTYLRALQTIPNLSIHFGQFRTDVRRTPLVLPIIGAGPRVKVLITREKGSDVNVATYMLVDTCEQDYEQAVVISNDSDLATPIAMFRHKVGLPIGIVNPNLRAGYPLHRTLVQAASFQRRLREKTLAECQFSTLPQGLPRHHHQTGPLVSILLPGARHHHPSR
jgi:hypothetical protein